MCGGESYRIEEIVGIHIDYANRPESGREADFVQDWCENRKKFNAFSSSGATEREREGLLFYKRVVNEVTRGVTDRSDYERISREIRYKLYQTVQTEYGSADDTGIIFGHHKGDVQENVISNVMRGISPLHLSGMSDASVANGVLVWRPLLEHSKQEIFDFAHKFGVPYLKDSTPSWSTRGKLRNQLVPLLVDIYGEGCLRNLSSLAVASDEIRQLITSNVYQPFLRSIRAHSFGLVVNVMAYCDQPVAFWREMLRELMHSMSMSMVREAAVQNFIERISRFNLPAMKGRKVGGWLELRKDFYTLLLEDGDLLIYRTGILHDPSQKRSKLHSCNLECSFSENTAQDNVLIITSSDVTALAPSNNHTGMCFQCVTLRSNILTIRGWKIEIVEVEQFYSTSSNLTLFQLLTGEFEYTVPADGDSLCLLSLVPKLKLFPCVLEIAADVISSSPASPGPYICENDWPSSLAGLDPKVRDALPILTVLRLRDNSIDYNTLEDESSSGTPEGRVFTQNRCILLKYKYLD